MTAAEIAAASVPTDNSRESPDQRIGASAPAV
jgi:hypothetical protein